MCIAFFCTAVTHLPPPRALEGRGSDSDDWDDDDDDDDDDGSHDDDSHDDRQ